MTTDHTIKRGVSLYSFQEEYFLRKMNLEDIIAACVKLDVPGIEIIGDQMIPGYPDIPEDFIEEWQGWIDRYGFTPVCLDMFLDTNKFDGREMTFDEMVESITKDILNAGKLGCSVIRMMKDVPIKVVEKITPVAEHHNIKLAFEVHAPNHLDAPSEQKLIELFDRLQSPVLGFTIDMGIFVRCLPRVAIDRFVRDGMKQSIADYLCGAYEDGSLPPGAANKELAEKVREMGGREEDIYMAHLGVRMVYSDPQRLLDYMPYILHCHGKFWEMLDSGEEYSIPYEEVIPVLIEGGYVGYINSEYEGNGWISDIYDVDSTEQVRRHQEMLKRLIGGD